MGVNNSRVHKLKSRDSDHVLEIESFDSQPNPQVRSAKTPDNQTKTPNEIEESESEGKVEVVEVIDLKVKNVPITDAEKRLHKFKADKIEKLENVNVSKQDESSGIFKDIVVQTVKVAELPTTPRVKVAELPTTPRIKTGTGIYVNPDVSPIQVGSYVPSPPTSPRKGNERSPRIAGHGPVTMSNADIIMTRRIGPQIGPLSHARSPERIPSKTEDKVVHKERVPASYVRELNAVRSNRPGQSEIISQLGEQGILPPQSETDRKLGELRQIGLISDQPDHYSSMDKAIREAPRLTPIQPISSLPPQQITNNLEQNIFDLNKNECCSPRGRVSSNVPVEDKKWNDDVLPLEIEVEHYGTTDRLRIRMMDLDLL